MAFYSVEGRVIPGGALTNISTTKQLPLGTIIRAVDPDDGEGEFIYLLGVANTVAGSWAHFNPDDFSTTLAVANGVGPLAIAMAANVADSYGWYQISGKASGACLTGFADNGTVYLTSTAGSVDDADVSGDYVYNAKGASASSSLAADFEIARPFTNDAKDD